MTAATYRRAYGSGHSYTLDGEPRIKGVTTMMRGLKGPPESYFTTTTAGYAIDHWDRLAGLPPSERLKEIGDATKTRFTAAGIRGTRVHRYAEQLARDEEVQVPDEIRGHVEACCQFLDDYHIGVIATEPALFSRKHRYAGSADLFATAILPGTTQRIHGLWDYKTSASGPWGSVAFQLSAYRYADFMLDGDGGKDSAEQPLPPVDQCFAVWLRGDGYDVYPVDTSPDILRQLLYIDQSRLADDECRHYKGDALPHPDQIRKLRLQEVQ
jgi:hypothetical protein